MRHKMNEGKKVTGFPDMASALVLAAAVTAAGLTGCGGTGASADQNASGDASGKDTAVAKDLSGSVSTNGSTSMESVIGILSESFMQENPGVTVTYDATGSGSGIEAVSNGTADIGLASRDLKEEEKEKGLEQTTIALDGIAVIVNADNPLTDLKLDDIASIYTGETTDWSAVGGSAGEIAVIGREAGSGTRDGFETITDTKDKCRLAQELTSTGAVIEAVKNNPAAIGYASFSSVKGQDGIKALTVDGVACSEDTIKDGSYKVQRDFNLITKKDTTRTSQAEAFYNYATSKDVSALIEKAGVVPTAE